MTTPHARIAALLLLLAAPGCSPRDDPDATSRVATTAEKPRATNGPGAAGAAQKIPMH